MGFTHPRKVYVITFENYPGFEMRVRSVSAMRLLDLAAAVESIDGVPGAKEMRELIGDFANALVSWNLEAEDGSPVPTTVEGIGAQDFDFLLEIISKWLEAIAGVSNPLDENSNSSLMELERRLALERSLGLADLPEV